MPTLICLLIALLDRPTLSSLPLITFFLSVESYKELYKHRVSAQWHLSGACFMLQVDIYSFGVVLWEIVTQDRGRRGQLRQTKVPEECPAEIEALIDQ